MGTITVAAAASKILTDALTVINHIRERAKSSKDSDLKEQILLLYDALLSLKESLLRITEENTQLKQRIAELERASTAPKPEIRQVGETNYYFVGDDGPYCQPCFDGKQILTMLSPQEKFCGGVRRRCSLCGQYFYEKPKERATVTVRRSGWMG